MCRRFTPDELNTMGHEASWRELRRVVFKIEKPYNQMVHMYTFIVTNMEELGHWQVIDYYCNRVHRENFIGEGKQGFDFASVSSRSRIVKSVLT